MSDFCRSCGAGVPPRYGEGTCLACQPPALPRDDELYGNRDTIGGRFALFGLLLREASHAFVGGMEDLVRAVRR